MRQIWAAVGYNFLGFFKNARTVITFLLSVILCFFLSEKVIEVARFYGTTMQAAEPFIWTFGDATAILLVSLLLIFLFSDLPKLSAFTPFYLLRMSKRKWLAAQFCYLFLVTVLYVGFVLLVTSFLCMKYCFPGNLWSETAAMLGYSQMGEKLQVPSTVKVMESITPYGCMVQVALLFFGYALTVGFLILLGNLILGKKYGMFFGVAYSLYGFLLDPKVLGKLLGLESYEMYKVRSVVGWISPLNQAVYGLHDFGYDNLPSVGQSLLLFALLAGIIAFFANRALRNYNFTFLGGQDGNGF